MNWKIFSLGVVWLFASLALIIIFSTQSKEWWIGDDGINNICDLMRYIENDDVRDFGIIITLPVFFPAIYAFFRKGKRYWFTYLVTAIIAGFWLWKFLVRYQLCLW